MHISGKILAGFVVIGWIVGLIFTSGDLKIRNAWMKRAQDAEEEFQKNDEQLVQKRALLANRRRELARVMLPWDRYWTKITGTPLGGAGDGKVQLEGVGSNHGLTEKHVIYLFAPNADGSSTLLGSGGFRVTKALEDRAALEPTWRMRAGDVSAKPGEWRARALVPAHYEARFSQLEVELIAADDALRAGQQELDRQTEAIKVATEHLNLRLNEINGNPDLEGKDLPPSIVKGLLTVLEDEEELRNAALAQVDRLLRDLKQTREAFDRVRQANVELTNSLPHPAATPPKVSATSR